jgi:vitamin B12 transporter
MFPLSWSVRRTMRPACAALLLSCLAVPVSRSQPRTANELDTVVVTAARSEQRLDDTLPSTTVITRADIERQQTRDLLDLLSRQAGVEIARSGGFGAQSSLFLRGTNSSQTLVLVDGVRLNTAVGGAATLGGINLDTVERIEIVRGNLSSLYGSEAIGGVVQIFTRGGGATGASAQAEAGAGHARAASLVANQRLDASEFGLAGGFREARPFSAIDAARVAAANPDLDASRNRSGSARLRQSFGSGADVTATVWTTHNDTDFDSTSDFPESTHHERSAQTAWQVAARIRATERWTSRLQGGETRDQSRNVSSEATSFTAGEFAARNRQLAWTNTVALLPSTDGQLGVEQVEQRGASTAYDPNFANALVTFERRVRAAWAGVTANAERQRLQLNLRRDDYSDVGSANTGLAAYGFQLTPQVLASAQYSTAFRAPSFNDLYFPGFGNPRLAPERARSLEGGLRYASAATSARLTIYRTRTRDLIVFDTATLQAQNLARVRIEGAEFSFVTTAADWHVDLSIDASRPVDESSDARLLRRAPYRATLAVDRAFGGFEVEASASHVAARYDSDINTFERVRLDPYTLVRLVLGYRASRAVRFTLRVENVTDARYELVSGYNTQRRGAFVGAEVRI